MTYDEMLKVTRKGKLGKLPNFIGYFKWNFVENETIEFLVSSKMTITKEEYLENNG